MSDVGSIIQAEVTTTTPVQDHITTGRITVVRPARTIHSTTEQTVQTELTIHALTTAPIPPTEATTALAEVSVLPALPCRVHLEAVLEEAVEQQAAADDR